MIRVSCIIATYNEKERIGAVLDVICKQPLIDEIIVVDDGSTDDTASVLSRFQNIKVLTHTKNKGKSFAVMTGLKESNGEFITLIDADLVGLTKENINNLISPVLENQADMTISLRKNAPIFWKLIGLDYISGERTFRKSMLNDQYENLMKIPKFGLEVFMNQIAIKNRYRIKIISWLNVYSPEKYVKHGFKEGIVAEIGMFEDIFKTVSLFGVIKEIIKMTRLKVK